MNKKDCTKRIILLFILGSIIVVAICFKIFNGNSQSKYRASEKSINYMAEHYPNAKFEKIKTVYRIDGDLYDTQFKNKTDEEFEFNIYIRNNTMYDNYYTRMIEYRLKKTINEKMKDYLEFDDFEVYFHDEEKYSYTIKEIAEDISKAKFNIVIEYHGELIKSKVAETSSVIVKAIFNNVANVESVCFKNYYNKEKEMFLDVEKININKNDSVEEIKDFILKQDFIFKINE